MLKRSIQKFFCATKVNDLIKSRLNFLALHAQQRTVEKDIFPPRQFRMKSSTHFQQTGNSTASNDFSIRWRRYLGEYFQEGRLPCSIPSDYSNRFARIYLQGNIIQRPEIFDTVRG